MNNSNIVQLKGIAASRGIAFGKIAFLRRNALPTKKRYIEDTQAELERFNQARASAITQLGDLYESSLEKLGEQNAVLFQIHQLMLDDPEYIQNISDLIVNEHANAEYAVFTTATKFKEMFLAMDNDYMQGRATDVIDVSRRVVEIMLSKDGNLKSHSIQASGNEDIILATDDLAPSETVQLDKNKVTGIITTQGSTRSHTVIFAKTMGMPSVIQIGSSLNESLEGKFVIVDGGAGLVLIEPDDATIKIYQERKRNEDALMAHLEQFRGKKTVTASGREIKLYANIGAVSDIDLVTASDAEGIGLFRSEYIYLNSKDYPDEQSQFDIYKSVLEEMHNKVVIIRTLDIGADKTADYFMLKHEDNPAMGLRAVRLCLTRSHIFKTQLRALYRASAFGNLHIMFPMITSIDEVMACKKYCQEVQDELKAEGIAFNPKVPLGIMVETPAAALISDELAPLVDFFSIGSNDLTQFTLAIDRQNAELNSFMQPYHNSVKKLIAMTIKNAHAYGKWVGICGELGADEHFTKTLIELDIDEISVVPSSILMMRAKISTLG